MVRGSWKKTQEGVEMSEGYINHTLTETHPEHICIETNLGLLSSL